MSLPGKGLEGHICPTIVMHGGIIILSFRVMHLVVQQKFLYCDQWAMSS